MEEAERIYAQNVGQSTMKGAENALLDAFEVSFNLTNNKVNIALFQFIEEALNRNVTYREPRELFME